MKLKKSPLQLKTVKIDSFHIDWDLENINVREINPQEYVVDLDFDIFSVQGKNTSNNLFLIELLIKINYSKRKEKKFPFKAKLKLKALFDFIEDVDESKKTQYLLYNGLSILYSFVRGYLFEKLDLLVPDHRIIPTVNLLDLIQKKANVKSKL